MKALELKIPPVLLFILFAVSMYALAAIDNDWLYMHIPLKSIWVTALFVFSGYMGISGVLEFKKAKTTVDPTKPTKASSVVDTGIFSKTRNPMYVALFTLLLSWGFWLEDGLSLFLSMFFIPYMNRFQIKPEERALEKIFGDDYLSYKAKVRRWI
ncbi:methyltransferase family protein [Vibrio mediterranei]|uniref:Isoprenylcysteine carboxylmethyltransferase family protein n=1 Tax=Vibrio mediterranei TaxID=689 RepID=A0A3G4V5J5_9VIBR|nr:isoprenylcysteine carboxylmethyltransferase family protein [Vibrio mediterranei]AYV20033.1 isoprenylcysteine carboxylmethyltransferase family protein [Vibrio mediterranei]